MDEIKVLIDKLRDTGDPKMENVILRLCSMIGRCRCGAELTIENSAGPYGDLCQDCWRKAGEMMSDMCVELGFPERSEDFLR